jgi:hypothetical protein
VSEPGAYGFRWTISNGTCASSQANVTVNFYATPTTATITSSPLNYCATLTSGALGGNTPTVGTGTWTKFSGPGTVTFSNPSSAGATATVSAAGTYVFRWTISNGNCTPTTADVTVNFYVTPTTASVTSSSLNYCNTLTTGSLGGITPTVGTGSWSQASGPGTSTFSAAASGSSTATSTLPGTYVYTWTISNGTCTPSPASVTVNYYELPTVAAVPVGPLNYCGTLTSGTLGGNTPIIGTGSWSKIS